MYAYLSLCVGRRTVHLSIALCAWGRDVVACLRGSLLSHSVWCAVSTVCVSVCRTGGLCVCVCVCGNGTAQRVVQLRMSVVQDGVCGECGLWGERGGELRLSVNVSTV